MRILDATCGAKQMWFQPNHPLVTYMDKRKGTVFNQYKNTLKIKRWKIEPDVVSEWKNAPFENNTFDLILFDPPHIIQRNQSGDMGIKYTVLNPDTWKQDLKVGIKKLFDILKPEGVFILKWDECHISIDEILKLFPYKPLFGTKSGKDNKNFWILFLKFNVNHTLNER